MRLELSVPDELYVCMDIEDAIQCLTFNMLIPSYSLPLDRYTNILVKNYGNAIFDVIFVINGQLLKQNYFLEFYGDKIPFGQFSNRQYQGNIFLTGDTIREFNRYIIKVIYDDSYLNNVFNEDEDNYAMYLDSQFRKYIDFMGLNLQQK